MPTRLALRIQNRIEQLSRSERRLAESLLDRHDDPLVYTAAELARQAGVSKATAARLFRSLGYRDFEEARLEAREERNRTAPARWVAAAPSAPSGASAVEAHLGMEVANLTRTFEELSTDRLRRAAHALTHAETVWTYGLGADAGVAETARILLARARPRVQRLGLAPGALAEEVAMVGPRDALLAIALRPQSTLIESVADFARATRLAIVALTDPASGERFRRLGAHTLICHAVGAAVGPSQSAALSMARLLSIAVAEQGGPAAQSRVALIRDVADELGGHH
jgi:DNA-binding MurR/RpiR family transcriptional regulator